MALEYQRYGRNKSTLVNKTYIESGEYRRKFDSISQNADVNRAVYSCAKEALRHRSGTETEDMYWIDGVTGKIVAKEIDSVSERKIVYSAATERAVSAFEKKRLIAVHTHPSSMPPSAADFNSCFRNGYKRGYVICHDGKVFGYTAETEVNERLYVMYIQKAVKSGLTEYDAQLSALRALKRTYDINFWEV